MALTAYLGWLTCHRAQNQAGPQADEGQHQLQRALCQPHVPGHELQIARLLLLDQEWSIWGDSGSTLDTGQQSPNFAPRPTMKAAPDSACALPARWHPP